MNRNNGNWSSGSGGSGGSTSSAMPPQTSGGVGVGAEEKLVVSFKFSLTTYCDLAMKSTFHKPIIINNLLFDGKYFTFHPTVF